MYYLLVQNERNEQYFQEVERGVHVRYCDLDGNTAPENIGSNWVIDANPTPPSWARPDTPIPSIEQPSPPSRIITRLEFRNRFTMQEKIDIYLATNTNVAIKIWLDDLTSAEHINLDDSMIIDSVNQLYTLGLITELRKDEILNA